MRPLPIVIALGFAVAPLAGCRNAASVGESTSPSSSPKGGAIRLAVVDDPAVAGAIRQLRTEWAGQSGWELTVEEISPAEFDSEKAITADAVFLPSAQLGWLAHRDLLLPLPDELARSAQANWSEIFDLVRSKEVAWKGKVVAVPFGSPVLTCYYRADLLEKLNQKPPATWKQYQQLAALLADRAQLGEAAPPEGQAWHGALEPLGPGWAGITLLARAAAYASHRGNYSTLFNVDTMDPLIDGPPFVRALEELVAATGPDGAEALAADPTAVRKAFWEGRCGMALTWPTAADPLATKPADELRVGFAELPGSDDVYNVTDHAWETRRKGEDPHVSLLAAAGRVGAVLRPSKSPDAAFQLLLWLSDPQWSLQVSTTSPATTLFRQSHLKNSGDWVEPAVPVTAAVEYAELTERALARQQSLGALGLPGRSDYLAALDAAVGKAVRREASPQDALKEAAIRWRELTQRLGVESQRKAYSSSLGLD